MIYLLTNGKNEEIPNKLSEILLHPVVVKSLGEDAVINYLELLHFL
jgi:hypothetical protein